MQKKQYIIFALSLFALLFICSALWYTMFKSVEPAKEKRIEEPLDVTFDFYNAWLSEVKGSGKVTKESALLSHETLSQDVRTKVAEAISSPESPDPVLCQTSVPDSIRAKIVHELPTEVEAIVMSKFASSTPTGYAVVKLSLTDRVWRIVDISCSKGDVLEDREFTFEQVGNLLKNVPAPLNQNYWHLVFTESGQSGHTVELHFSSSTACINTINPDVSCSVDSLIETTKAKVQGQATETGVDVVKIELLE